MRKEIGKYLLDVSKLVFAGVVLSSVLKVEDISKFLLLFIGLTVTFLLALFGFLYIKKGEK